MAQKAVKKPVKSPVKSAKRAGESGGDAEKPAERKRRGGWPWWLFVGLDRLLDAATVLLFGVMIAIGGYAIYDSYRVYDSATLSDDILALAPSGEDFYLKDLQAINPDIVAWVQVDGTHIDYPVVVGKDNTEYLNLDYKKDYATAGSVFLDYRNDRYFADDYSIIYGHNMRADLMFSDIKRFENTAFFNTHRVGTLWTETGVYRLEFLYYAKFNAFNNGVYNLITYRNGRNEEVAQEVRANALNSRGGELGKLLLLSTCNTAGSNDRAVLLARMELIAGSEAIGDEERLQQLEREKELLERSGSGAGAQREAHVESQSWFTGLAAWFGGWTIRDVMLFVLVVIVVVIFLVLVVMEVKRRVKRRGERDDDERTGRSRRDSRAGRGKKKD